eukprot:scaffold567999_cov44-Prasinocladus_malaysianus.AAC.1
MANGADLDAQDNTGLTPLHMAVVCGCKEVALQMILRGASLQIEDCDGKTALSAAPAKWHKEMLDSELSFGSMLVPTKYQPANNDDHIRPLTLPDQQGGEEAQL